MSLGVSFGDGCNHGYADPRDAQRAACRGWLCGCRAPECQGSGIRRRAEPSLEVSEAGIGQSLSVSVKRIEALGGSNDERYWSVVLGFEHLPVASPDARFLKVSIGDQVKRPLSYKVALYNPPELTWSVGNPTKEWLIGDVETTSFTVTVGAVPARNLRLSHSTLQRTDKRIHLTAVIFICVKPSIARL